MAQHVAFGGLKETYTQEFFNFPSQTVNSSDLLSEGRTLLHLAATINTTDVLELLLPHFSCIDCVDSRGITPAFLAAKRGLRDNKSEIFGEKRCRCEPQNKVNQCILQSQGKNRL